MLNLGKLL